MRELREQKKSKTFAAATRIPPNAKYRKYINVNFHITETQR